MRRTISLIVIFMIIGGRVVGQAVGIGTSVPDNSAQLEVNSTQKGMLVPRMTAAQRGAIPQPATGLMVYQTDGNAGFYYNNGTPPNWLLLLNSGGAIGQNAQTVYGTGSVTLMTLSPFTLVPGLTLNLNLSSTLMVYISTNGGITTTSLTTTGFSVVDVAIFIDGVEPVGGDWQRINISNTSSLVGQIGNWALSKSVMLSPGLHTIEVRASGSGIGGTADANVSSGPGTLTRGVLTVLVLKQ